MKFLRRSLKTLARDSEDPSRIAIAFTVGVFCGFSPLVGLHTVMGLALAFLFRLNKVAVLLGVYLNNPWVIVPYYALSTWIGLKLTGLSMGVDLSQYGLSDLLTLEFWSWVTAQWRLLIPPLIGSSILCVVLTAVAYPVSLYVMHRIRGSENSRMAIEGGPERGRDDVSSQG